MASAGVMRELRQRGFTQVELARRVGVARETLSRWESGLQRPSLEDLERVVCATGARLELQIVPAERELVEMIDEDYELGPSERLRGLLGRRWPACRAALAAVAQTGERAVLVGPVGDRAGGVALNATGRPGTVRVATVEDPLAIAEHSPWSEDTLYKAGLRAVLASSHSRAAHRPRPLVA